MPSGSRPDAANQEDLDLALGKLHGACVITVAGCQDNTALMMCCVALCPA